MLLRIILLLVIGRVIGVFRIGVGEVGVRWVGGLDLRIVLRVFRVGIIFIFFVIILISSSSFTSPPTISSTSN